MTALFSRFHVVLLRMARTGLGWLLVTGLAVSASAQSNSLPPSWQQKTFQGVFSDARTYPRVDHGYLFSFRDAAQSQASPNILLQSLAGGTGSPIAFWMRGASELQIEDVSIGPIGRIYVVGSFLRKGEMVATSFVAELDSSGHLTASHELGSYMPKRVCASEDNTFWTLGQIVSDETSGPGSMMLRKYSADGRLLGSYVSRNDFPVIAKIDFKVARVQLVCGEQSVGAYLGPPARRWIEVQFADGAESRWQVPAIDSSKITGISLFGKNQVYASFLTKAADGVSEPVAGLYRLKLDQADQANWSAIPAGTVYRLVGRDGQSLVYTAGSAFLPSFYWVKPQR